MSDTYLRQPRNDLVDWIRPHYGSSVLEIGCGEGVMGGLLRIRGCGPLVGIEPNDSAARTAGRTFDQVHVGRVEEILPTLPDDQRFDLIVCADVLEHLLDPWSIVKSLRRVAVPGGVLALSVPNIRYLPALAQIAVGRGFEYSDSGIFDRTHLRFFTRRNVNRLLHDGGWTPRRWSTPQPGRLGRIRRGLSRLTMGASDEWGSRQWYVVATNDSK